MVEFIIMANTDFLMLFFRKMGRKTMIRMLYYGNLKKLGEAVYQYKVDVMEIRNASSCKILSVNELTSSCNKKN